MFSFGRYFYNLFCRISFTIYFVNLVLQIFFVKLIFNFLKKRSKNDHKVDGEIDHLTSARP